MRKEGGEVIRGRKWRTGRLLVENRGVKVLLEGLENF
jgi:hypothetical protein